MIFCQRSVILLLKKWQIQKHPSLQTGAFKKQFDIFSKIQTSILQSVMWRAMLDSVNRIFLLILKRHLAFLSVHLFCAANWKKEKNCCNTQINLSVRSALFSAFPARVISILHSKNSMELHLQNTGGSRISQVHIILLPGYSRYLQSHQGNTLDRH